MERQASDDLLNSQLWDKTFQELEAGLWDVVVMSPPCNTFSRVRFNWKTSPGPRPLRNFNWPRGFPWLTGSNLQLAQDHNYLVDQTIATAHKCFQCNADFLIEHPEDLGACHGEWPASIWQWETMQQLQQATKATLGQFSSVILTRHRPSVSFYTQALPRPTTCHVASFRQRTTILGPLAYVLWTLHTCQAPFGPTTQREVGHRGFCCLPSGALQIPGRAHRQPGGERKDLFTRPTCWAHYRG